MTTNDTESKIHELIAAWNKATSQTCNPARFINQGYAFIEAGVTPDEVSKVARYLVIQNNKASEAKYKAPLNLYNLISNVAKFDSLLQLAQAHFRNHKPKTDRDSVLAAAGNPVERDATGKPINTDPTRRISIDLVTQAMHTLQKGN